MRHFSRACATVGIENRREELGILETTTKELEGNKLELTVTLTTDEVQQEIDAAYKQAGKNRIPGFRPGKAPRKILENHFGGKEYFLAKATDELIRIYSPVAPDLRI